MTLHARLRSTQLKWTQSFHKMFILILNRIWIHTFLQIYLQFTKRKVSSGPFKATWFKPLLTFWQLWDFSSAIMVKWVESSQLKWQTSWGFWLASGSYWQHGTPLINKLEFNQSNLIENISNEGCKFASFLKQCSPQSVVR